MNAELIDRLVFPALSVLLPQSYDTPEARAMLIAVALQESGLRERRQIARYDGKLPVYGPARGWWMFERIGVQGVMEHRASREGAAVVVAALDYPWDSVTVHLALEHNDILAGAMARMLLRTHPDQLPRRGEKEVGWEQYLALWRPGKPKEGSWAGCWEKAWEVVEA